MDVADDVLHAVKERARRERRSMGEVLSDLAREALTGATRSGGMAEGRGRYGFDPFPRRGPAVSNALIDELREDERE